MASLRRILSAFVAALLAAGMAASVWAVNPHEDPSKSQPAYSAVTLFRYYSAAIDSILAYDPVSVAAKLDKMVYANLPDSVSQATGGFVASSESCTWLILNIETGIADLKGLLDQSRLTEATSLANKIIEELASAYNDVRQMEDSAVFTGTAFGVLKEPRTSDLCLAYEDTLRKIVSVRSLLDLDRDLLTGLRGGISASSLASATDLTLAIELDSAFVGDSVRLYGRLTSKGKPLGGRDINVLLNSERQTTVRTNASGSFDTVVAVPYWYTPTMQAQVLYYPREADMGVYLASLSPPVALHVLYYEASLSISFDGMAHPGRATTVKGRLAYSPDAEMIPREMEMYLDNVLLAEFSASDEFTQTIAVPPDAKAGKHTVTFTASADGRYAPALSDAVLDINKAEMKLDMRLPQVIFIPGGLDLTGGVGSELGPAQNAHVKVVAGNYTHEFRTAADGSFQQQMRLSFEFGLVGTASMDVTVYPTEPWNQPLTISRKIFVVNSIVSGAFILAIVVAGVLLPRRLRLRPAHWRRRRKSLQPEPVGAVPVTPQYSDLVAVPAGGGNVVIGVEPRVRVFSWYALVLRLVQRSARVVFRPQQTHREFVAETRKALGPLADHLMQFTRMVERLLYSRARATDADVQTSEQLGRRLQDGLKVKQ